MRVRDACQDRKKKYRYFDITTQRLKFLKSFIERVIKPDKNNPFDIKINYRCSCFTFAFVLSSSLRSILLFFYFTMPQTPD